jgi:hypothetical protein
VKGDDSKAETFNGGMIVSPEREWNDESRDELRAPLRSFILGELRLMKNDQEAILDACRETRIDDECPEDEWETFVRYASDELDEAEARLAAEKSTWPAETDCDRLDRVEAALRDRGILLWQVSPCCDTCTRSELSGRISLIDERHPGFRGRIRGYAFFIDQNMPEMLSEGPEILVYLGYGWLSASDAEVSEQVYETNALGIAREVMECLQQEGFDVDWDGQLARKLGLAIRWQRRRLVD